MIDTNNVHVSSCHQHQRDPRGTAKKHKITPTGVLQPCGCRLEAWILCSIAQRGTTLLAGCPWTTSPRICSDATSGPWAGRYICSCLWRSLFEVDAAIRCEENIGYKREPYKKLVDKNVMRTSYNIRADNGGGLIGRDYVDFCDSAEIGREKTAPKKRQQNVVVESAT